MKQRSSLPKQRSNSVTPPHRVFNIVSSISTYQQVEPFVAGYWFDKDNYSLSFPLWEGKSKNEYKYIGLVDSLKFQGAQW
jgi:hypothetical protein